MTSEQSQTHPDGPRLPAEWEPHDSVWISWPLNPGIWPGRLPRLQKQFAELVELLSRYVPVSINAAAEQHENVRAALTSAGADLRRCWLMNHPTNDVWCRDHGPIFVHTAHGGLAVTDWQFNAWGGKFSPWNLDNEVPRRVAETLGLARFESSLVLEGGAIETDGAGLLLTTETVLLNENRNPDWTKERIEQELRRLLGVRHVFWFANGIDGDDTDGHVDDFCRFVRPGRVVCATEQNEQDANFRVLRENRERLADLRDTNGRVVEVVELPMPVPLTASNWRQERLPASYANFLITNGAVIVPTFSQPQLDQHAVGILADCFPDREVVGFDCQDFVFEGGAVHCLTQQQPCLPNDRSRI